MAKKFHCDVALEMPFNSEEVDLAASESPIVYFEKVFPRSLVEHIVEQTIIYSKQHSRDVNVSCQELLGIICIMMYSGYKPTRNRELLWSAEEDVSLQWAKDLMSKNRFRAILRDLHLADNSSLNSDDPYYKVRPYYEKLNQSFIQSLSLDENLCVDEIMVPYYYGRHGTKQFIKGITKK